MNWLYEINDDNSARFTLGEYNRKTAKTLICFGINPSTATPQSLDNTIKKVKVLARNNGYENWIMLNVYPQRATNPNDLHLICDDYLNQANLVHIERVLSEFTNSDLLFAFGNLITIRAYLSNNLRNIISFIKASGWKGESLCIKLTKKGFPVHPLYQSNSATFVCYPI